MVVHRRCRQRRTSSASNWTERSLVGEAIQHPGQLADLSGYVELAVGEPAQSLDFDIDMLGPDFYTVMTTSGKGSKYDTFASQSHGEFELPSVHAFP